MSPERPSKAEVIERTGPMFMEWVRADRDESLATGIRAHAAISLATKYGLGFQITVDEEARRQLPLNVYEQGDNVLIITIPPAKTPEKDRLLSVHGVAGDLEIHRPEEPFKVDRKFIKSFSVIDVDSN